MEDTPGDKNLGVNRGVIGQESGAVMRSRDGDAGKKLKMEWHATGRDQVVIVPQGLVAMALDIAFAAAIFALLYVAWLVLVTENIEPIQAFVARLYEHLPDL